MTDIIALNGQYQIPPEALEAVARKLAMLCEDGTENWQDYLFDANDLCLAMLKAWPGMVQYPVMEIDCTPPKIVLPLTQENTNDEG